VVITDACSACARPRAGRSHRRLCRKYDPRSPRLRAGGGRLARRGGSAPRARHREVTGGRADVLIGTLGKAMASTRYIACEAPVIRWLRERNPSTLLQPDRARRARPPWPRSSDPRREGWPALAPAATTQRSRWALRLGFETTGQHPWCAAGARHRADPGAGGVPARERRAATGSTTRVPRGEQLIRFQSPRPHGSDIDQVSRALKIK